jgi:hypothetical protein
MNQHDDVFRPGLILGVLVASLIGIGALCLAAPADPGPGTSTPSLVESTLRQ